MLSLWQMVSRVVTVVVNTLIKMAMECMTIVIRD